MTKNDLRTQYKQIRSAIPLAQKQKYSESICQSISEYIHKKNREHSIALFAGTADEPNLLPLLADRTKKWCFPKVLDWKNKKKPSMEFFRVESVCDLSPNSFGIYEPLEHCTKVSLSEIELACVPGVSIDIDGNRVGMGGGFYDSFFSEKKSLTLAGVVFPEQISDEKFVTDPWDIKMDIVFCGTQKGL